MGKRWLGGDPTTDSEIGDRSYNDNRYLQDLTSEDLSTLSDVVISAVANNEVLAYDSGGNWINQTASEAGLASTTNLSDHEADTTNIHGITDTSALLTDITGENLTDLSDVVISGTPADNEVLAWNTGTSKFINQTAAEAGLSVTGHSHVTGDITGFDAQVQSSRLDQMAAPTGAVSMNNQTLSAPLDPTAGTHVGDRDYNDGRYINVGEAPTAHNHDADYVDIDGDDMTGRLTSTASLGSSSTGTGAVIFGNNTSTVTSGSGVYGQALGQSFGTGVKGVGKRYGLYGLSEVTDASGTNLTGVSGWAQQYVTDGGGPYTGTLLVANQGYVDIESYTSGDTVTVTDSINLWAEGPFLYADSSGTVNVTNSYGLLVAAPDISTATGGAVNLTNSYGIYVEDPAGAGDTITRAIHIDGGESYFGGAAHVVGKLTVDADPTTGDHVGNRDFNDTRYINVGEAPTAHTHAHNDTTSIQGGTASQYYHLTSAQHTDLTDSGDSTIHYHATDRARANHTGTQAHTTISDFDTGVRTNRLDQMAAPTATVSMNSQYLSNPLDPTLGTHVGDRDYNDARYINVGEAPTAHTHDVLSNVASARIIGRTTAGSGNSEELTQANMISFLGIEAGATADQSNAEIRTAVEAATDSNVFTDADHTKLNAITGTNTGDEPAASTTVAGIVELATIAEVNTGTDATRAVTPDSLEGSDLQIKVDGIETGATADQTNTEIRDAVEAASNSNTFTDADHTKLNAITGTNTGDEPAASTTVAGIVELATIAEVNTGTDATRAVTPDSLEGSALQIKVDGIEALAEVNNISDANATDLTDAGASTLHYHTADRARANHTGTQLHTTISDFDAGVQANRLDQMAAPTATVSMNNRTLSSPLDPTAGTHVGDRDYNDARYLELSGGSMTGNIVMGTGDQLDFGNNTGSHILMWSNTFGFGIESSTLTAWSATNHRWRIGGTSASTGTERMLLTGSELTLTGVKIGGTITNPTADDEIGDRGYNDGRYSLTGHNHSGTYEPAGTVATHAAAADPHTGYQKESEKAAASGYASLDGSTKVPYAQLPTGTAASTVAIGNHNHSGVYATSGHDHDSDYLGITAKAADSEKLDNIDSTSFLRSDAADNVTSGITKFYGNNDTTLVDGTGHIQIGSDAGINIGIDENEIQCRSGSASSALYLNNHGGNVQVQDRVLIGGSGSSESLPAIAGSVDTNTGIRWPSGDVLAITTGSADQLTVSTTTVDCEANILTNVADPSNAAHVGDQGYNDARYSAKIEIAQQDKAGNTATSSTSYADTGITTLTVSAATDDWLELNVSGHWNNEAVAGRLDGYIADGADYMSGNGSGGTGHRSWAGGASLYVPTGGSLWYKVVAANVVGGEVDVKIYIKASSASTKTLLGPVRATLINHGGSA